MDGAAYMVYCNAHLHLARPLPNTRVQLAEHDETIRNDTL